MDYTRMPSQRVSEFEDSLRRIAVAERLGCDSKLIRKHASLSKRPLLPLADVRGKRAATKTVLSYGQRRRLSEAPCFALRSIVAIGDSSWHGLFARHGALWALSEKRGDEVCRRERHDQCRQPSNESRPRRNDELAHDLAIGTDFHEQDHDWNCGDGIEYRGPYQGFDGTDVQKI